MIDLDAIIRQLTASAAATDALLRTVTEEQAQWKPDPETWSMTEVMDHVYNEERVDFRKHLKEMFHVPQQPWGDWDRSEFVTITNLGEGLDGFLSERIESIAWLKALESPDWDMQSAAPWGEPISAGDVLVSWVAHDFLHLRQMNELNYAWNVKQAAPHSVKYAGDW